MKPRGYDVLGNVAIVKFDRGASVKQKRKFAISYLRKNKQITTVLEKSGKISGRLRTPEAKWLAGEKTKEALYRENGCEFRLNVDTCYFSPRLSSERKYIASLVKKNESVLVMFGGVAPFAITISKFSKAKRVVSVELSRECNKYALINIKRNKLEGIASVVQGDVRKVIGKGKKIGGKFDRIVMARPNLADSFLDVAFPIVKKSGVIHYYGFYSESDLGDLRKLIENEAKKARKKIKILRIVKAGDIGVRKWRFRADIRLLH